MNETIHPTATGLVESPIKQHTPGPWHWEADAVKGDPTGRVRYQVTALGKTVTRVYYSSYEGGPTNAEADAKLIAAAPELMAALEEINKWCCYASKENASTRLMVLQQIEVLARDAMARAI
jgi:hypothetical protein